MQAVLKPGDELVGSGASRGPRICAAEGLILGLFGLCLLPGAWLLWKVDHCRMHMRWKAQAAQNRSLQLFLEGALRPRTHGARACGLTRGARATTPRDRCAGAYGTTASDRARALGPAAQWGRLARELLSARRPHTLAAARSRPRGVRRLGGTQGGPQVLSRSDWLCQIYQPGPLDTSTTVANIRPEPASWLEAPQ